MGFEPTTSSLEGNELRSLNVDKYREFLQGKYSKGYARMQLSYALKHFDCLKNPAKLLSIPVSDRPNVLKGIVCLSKYLGCYEEFKSKMKNHGIKWTNSDTAFNGFKAIFNKKHSTLGLYINEILPYLHENEKLFVRFLATTGLRKNEAVTGFNKIIELNNKGNLSEYYNSELSVLEHFNFPELFLRGTKNCYISFVSHNLVEQICLSQPVSYTAIMSRLSRKQIKLRFKELRSYNNSYLRKQGIISELVDVLAGRVPKTVFARHYLGEDMKTLSSQVLAMQTNLEKSLVVAEDSPTETKSKTNKVSPREVKTEKVSNSEITR